MQLNKQIPPTSLDNIISIYFMVYCMKFLGYIHVNFWLTFTYF